MGALPTFLVVTSIACISIVSALIPKCVLDGLKGEDSIAELFRREGLARSLYYSWPKEFPEPGNKRFAGDTACGATSSGGPL